MEFRDPDSYCDSHIELPLQKDERRSLDELFHRSTVLRTSDKFFKLLNFICKFRHYSPYNNALVFIQNPEVIYFATAKDWWRKFGRYVKQDARPMVILAPMTPVLFVYDLDDTYGKPLPDCLTKSFEVKGHISPSILPKTIENCSRLGIVVREKKMSSLHAGTAIKPKIFGYLNQGHADIKIGIELNQDLGINSKYATLIHEIGHVLLGHVGNDKDQWWDDRSSISKSSKELEAEAVSFLITNRLELETKSAEYCCPHLEDEKQLEEISYEMIIKTAGLVERMGQKNIPQKKHNTSNIN